MIGNTVRARFRKVYWRKEAEIPPAPVVFCANHHGWHDGYLMFHLVKAVNRPSLDWIAEYDAFPLFRYAGGLPFPPNDVGRRTATLRKTIREMNAGRSLILFPEVHLHTPPEILEVGKSVELLQKQAPSATFLPVSIVYRMDLHERPEAFMSVGNPVESGPALASRLRERMAVDVERLKRDALLGEQGFEVLVEGTLDVNERWDVRKKMGKKG